MYVTHISSYHHAFNLEQEGHDGPGVTHLSLPDCVL